MEFTADKLHHMRVAADLGLGLTLPDCEGEDKPEQLLHILRSSSMGILALVDEVERLQKVEGAVNHILERLDGPMYSSGVFKGSIKHELRLALKGETVE